MDVDDQSISNVGFVDFSAVIIDEVELALSQLKIDRTPRHHGVTKKLFKFNSIKTLTRPIQKRMFSY